MQLMLKVLAILAVAGIAALFAMWLFQRRLIYYPDPRRTQPVAVGLGDVAEAPLVRPDGTTLIAWYGAAAAGQPTLLYFHGNAGNLATRAERIAAYRQDGRGMLMLSYRGYGGSGGAPSEADNVADALAAYDSLRDRGVAPHDIYLYGESLGSGVAVQVAIAREVGGIILDAPFTSLAAVGAQVYPFLPVELVIWDRYDSLARIGQVTAPLLIIHGGRDSVVPFAMGERLFEAANEPKKFVPFPRAGHSDHHLYGSYQAVSAWIDANRTVSRPAAAQ